MIAHCIRTNTLASHFRSASIALIAVLSGSAAIASTSSAEMFSITTTDTNLFDGISADANISFAGGGLYVWLYDQSGIVTKSYYNDEGETAGISTLGGTGSWDTNGSVNAGVLPDFDGIEDLYPGTRLEYMSSDTFMTYTIELSPHTLLTISADAEILTTVNGSASAGLTFWDGFTGYTSDSISTGARELSVTYASGDQSELLSLYRFARAAYEAPYQPPTYPTPVPEPSSYALMFAGLLGLGSYMKRKRSVEKLRA